MGRPKGSKNKPKAAPPKVKAKAKAKAKPPTKAEPPDWLRRAMAVAPTKPKAGRKPNVIKEKFARAKAKRGRTMANKPSYDPLDDPDLKAGEKGDAPGWESPIKPPARPDNTFPGADTKPVDPRPGQKPALPGGGVAPDNALPEPEEPAPFDEVASGAPIPDENVETLIAGTLGGSGDAHANAKLIMRRMYDDAGWQIIKALDEGSGDIRKGKGKPKDDKK